MHTTHFSTLGFKHREQTAVRFCEELLFWFAGSCFFDKVVFFINKMQVVSNLGGSVAGILRLQYVSCSPADPGTQGLGRRNLPSLLRRQVLTEHFSL